MSLSERARSVCDAASFLAFVRELHAELHDTFAAEAVHPSSPYGQAANGWENLTLERFLEAGISWAEDSNFAGRTDENPWRLAASFLMAGKVYE